MQNQVQKRIDSLRSEIARERARLVNLKELITDREAGKQVTQIALLQLEDVESMYLSEAHLGADRTFYEWEAWLDGAERALSIAAKSREHAEVRVATFGPSIRTTE
jgi:hypothetical protein